MGGRAGIIPEMPRRDTRRTVKEKLQIVLEAERGTIRGTARIYQVQPSQIRRWRKARHELEQSVKRNPNAKSVNEGRPTQSPEIEQSIVEWIRELRSADIAVSTRQVIAKALSLDPQFHGRNIKTLWHWVYPFLDRHHLSIRRATHVGQKLRGHLLHVQNDFVEMVNERFQPGGTLEGTPPSMFVNMDETAIF